MLWINNAKMFTIEMKTQTWIKKRKEKKAQIMNIIFFEENHLIYQNSKTVSLYPGKKNKSSSFSCQDEHT